MGETILDIIKFILPAIAVIVTAYLVLSTYLRSQLQQKAIELSLQQKQQTLPLRLQAYERLILFLERNTIPNLVSRQTQQDTVPEMQMMLVAGLRSEYEHNLTQQLYVSSEAWNMIRAVTEDTIGIINRIGVNLPNEANGMALCRALLEHYVQNPQAMPNQFAIEQLKSEARGLL
ncbi:MAG: hypothetical protein IPI59_15135 [Sphingobacteriales bacterium]|jgi:hypothetical protein|nr:hypothetical protein [Sphingobacteriales bacterium]MBP9140600.1 hypothetical protein [Chitinophagales bacterium]MDA0197390.1 hypothetical protein [Bacteroidota bacterium]MBK6888660.1 hypothetical protein [Sphingobacteriales bacterium]MBK7528831.1 hypothetical protein [Sphingobacteriales bacterium]